jgi:hypothetical protein
MTEIRRYEMHGMTGTPTYNSWHGMKQRCIDPNRPEYERYGGRGIKIIPEWISFAGFFADMGVCPEGLSLDRIDNNGNYEPGNCRWATRTQQNRNTGLRSTNASGVKGVCWIKRDARWRAQIRVGYKTIYLGQFTALKAAAAARKRGEATHWAEVE